MGYFCANPPIFCPQMLKRETPSPVMIFSNFGDDLITWPEARSEVGSSVNLIGTDRRRSFSNTGISIWLNQMCPSQAKVDNWDTPMNLPYFEGDHWPELIDTRNNFLTISRDEHWEFSQLRRVKWSTLEFCHMLHRQDSCHTCNLCEQQARYHCSICHVISFSNTILKQNQGWTECAQYADSINFELSKQGNFDFCLMGKYMCFFG
jgi:hypothetical protein